MKKILKAYRNLLSILYKQSPVMVMMVFIFSVIGGLISPITIYINQQVFNNAIAVANQQWTSLIMFQHLLYLLY